MDLLKNPFHTLSASPRDNRRRIMELAEEGSLFLDAEACAEARSILTHPRKRLTAEMSWLPELSPAQVAKKLNQLAESPETLPEEHSIPPLARANLLAAGLTRLKNPEVEDISAWILDIAEAYEETDTESLLASINAERIASGFPEVDNVGQIEEELAGCRATYRAAIKAALDTLPSRELIHAVTVSVDADTSGGETPVSTIVADTIDSYEVEIQPFLEKEELNLDLLIGAMKEALNEHASDARLQKILNLLSGVARNWKTAALPIQISAKSRGLDHEPSRHLAAKIRSLALASYNDYGRLDIPRQLTDLIRDLFAEVDSVVERAEEDSVTLEELGRQKEYSRNAEETFRKDITYEAGIGFFSKEHFRMSPDGIEWKGRRWNLNSITRLRWGGVQDGGGILSSGVSYAIMFGTDTDRDVITLNNKKIFMDITDRLWKAVGIRLLLGYLNGLRKGKEYIFNTALISNYGIELEHTGFATKKEKTFCTWREVYIKTVNGKFYIFKADDPNFYEVLSYRDNDNTYIIETAIRALFQKGCSRLSDLI